MYRIETQKTIDPTSRWEPVGDARYLNRESAEKAQRRHVEDALDDAARLGLPRTPRFRIVEARQVVACATVQ